MNTLRLHPTSAALFCLALFPPVALANELVISTVEQYLQTQTQGLPGKVTTSVSPLDPRTQLAPCAAMEPFTLPGSRLWGKSTVGVRCLGPANWTVYVPVQIRITGSYVVSVRPLAPGQPLTAADLATRQGDLTNMPPSVLSDPAQGIGKTLKSGLGSGQPVRSDILIAPYVIQQGQDVRLISKGPGFAVSNEGKALNNASEGQMARARTSGGQTVSGIARPGGIIEIAP
ncbi:MAG: flagellar basal body P-ring formation protein FlgA [Betaproteobacteria bacterium]|nr:flagellar basal body P-ring formation protein FlgA [Betaproteobacteria bacterium]